MDIFIEEVNETNFEAWLMMGLDLWPDYTRSRLSEILVEVLESEKEKAYVCRTENEYAGFINVSIRFDYVPGSRSSPVGYVEGLYVKPHLRKRGIAQRLLRKGEEWASSKGCSQIASDVELENEHSYNFHRQIGFEEVQRVTCLIKDIS